MRNGQKGAANFRIRGKAMFNESIISSIPEIPVRVDYTQKRGMVKGLLSQMHYHDEIELIYVTSGVMEVELDSGKYTVESGNTVFVNSRTPHSTYAVVDGTSGILIQLRIEDFFDQKIRSMSKYLPRFANAGDTPIMIFEENEGVGERIKHIMKEYSAKESAFEVYILGEVYGILAFLFRRRILVDASTYYNTKAVQKLIPVLEYVNENYSKDITLDEISTRFGFNPSYFSRMFKKALGSGYSDYLAFVRICKAEKLLRDTDMSIIDVSLEVGFSSVSYFNKVFKKHKNCTPTLYKKAMYNKM